MDSLREAVYLRAYGQKDPLIEFKTEAYEMFTELMGNIKGEILHNLFRSTSNLLAFEQFLANLPHMLIAPDETGGSSQTSVPGSRGGESAGDRLRHAAVATVAEPEASLDLALHARSAAAKDPTKVGRNDPCPCGSGKKFKNCCGRPA
jgi:preprotein translocase subunit SecA